MVTTVPDIEQGEGSRTSEEFHAEKVAEVQAFLALPATERGAIVTSSVVDRESQLPAYEEPVEVRDAVSDMSRAMRALQESATFTKLPGGDFEAVVDVTVGKAYLGEGLERAVFTGRNLGAAGGYELTLRKTERRKLVDGSFSETGGNWGDTKVTLKPDSVKVHTQDNKQCVWSRETNQ